MQSFCSSILVLLTICILVPQTFQLQSSQSWSLLRIKQLLNYPSFLSSWNNFTDFCNSEPNPSVTIVCYEDSITQLQINGDSTTYSSSPLPHSFSIDSLFTTITRFPDLRVLSLTSLGLWGHLPTKISRLPFIEIVNMSSNFLYGSIPQEVSYLRNLQTLILDHNMFSGRVPEWLGSLPLLVVLSLKNNTLNGPLPESVRSLESLRVLDLSLNSLSGQLPDLSELTNLQVLDLGRNYFGPQFPSLGKKVVVLVLRKNRFGGGLPSELSSYSMLEKFDVSLNRFVGPFMLSLLSLPSIRYVDIAGNRFTGLLFENLTCNEGLEYVDFSRNLLTGSLPMCLISENRKRVVSYSANCLESEDRNQHPISFCQNQAFAVGILPHKRKKASHHKAAVAISAVAASVSVIALVVFLTAFLFRKTNTRRPVKRPPRRLIEHASNGYPSKMLADARYISQTMKLSALGVPSYRTFSLDELEAATNNFDSSAFIGEGSHGQMYRGMLHDGSLVAIRCLKLKKSHSSHNFNRHIELISKLRHRHLVSALGHCFEYYLDDSTVSRLFLVFEYVSNGTLRSNISESFGGPKLTWSQRIGAAIGVAKGIEFLHAGIIPGLFENNLKITNVLLDQNLVAKISSYNLPVLTESMKNEVIGGKSSNGLKVPSERAKHGDKIDIYDFGVILLEIISGKSITSESDIDTPSDQLQAIMTADGVARKQSVVDPVIRRGCCMESLNTLSEICIRCVSKDATNRPSIEDVLWNLQFAAQVQDAWRGDSVSSEGSSMTQSPIN